MSLGRASVGGPVRIRSSRIDRLRSRKGVQRDLPVEGSPHSSESESHRRAASPLRQARIKSRDLEGVVGSTPDRPSSAVWRYRGGAGVEMATAGQRTRRVSLRPPTPALTDLAPVRPHVGALSSFLSRLQEFVRSLGQEALPAFGLPMMAALTFYLDGRMKVEDSLEPMGVRSESDSDSGAAGPGPIELRRRSTERLGELLPHGKLKQFGVIDKSYIAEVLGHFGVTGHEVDVRAFQNGFFLGKNQADHLRETAFDIDEVYLHWGFSVRDLFAGTNFKDLFRSGPQKRGGTESSYYNTTPDLLDYQPFEVDADIKLGFWEGLWFKGITKIWPGALRQHVQFSPGVRAFQLGLRIGSGENLIMVTTGPAGRILLLANEDPAMKMIYFGKMPDEAVTIDDVRNLDNIYTREHLVLAMRKANRDSNIYLNDEGTDEDILDYYAYLSRYPKKAAKLKHPAIAQLLGKRPFRRLVDDSSSTYKMLGGKPHFAIFQVPSARSKPLLNFRPFETVTSYLARMSNDYSLDLNGWLLDDGDALTSRVGEALETPKDYPHQRLTLEIPWDRFEAEFIAPAAELKALAKQTGRRRGQRVPARVSAEGE